MSLSTVEVSVLTNNKESDISVNSVTEAARGRSWHCNGSFLEAWGSFEVEETTCRYMDYLNRKRVNELIDCCKQRYISTTYRRIRYSLGSYNMVWTQKEEKN